MTDKAVGIIENEIRRLEGIGARDKFGNVVVQHVIEELKLVLKKITGVEGNAGK